MVVAVVIGVLVVAASIWALFFSRQDDHARVAARGRAQDRVDRGR